jgi:hypothetical protein
LSGISAANADPEIIASAVANKTNFFISIPIAFQEPTRFPDAPRANHTWLKSNFLNPGQSEARSRFGEAKNSGICRLFVRFRVSTKRCWYMLHFNNNLGGSNS